MENKVFGFQEASYLLSHACLLKCLPVCNNSRMDEQIVNKKCLLKYSNLVRSEKKGVHT